MSYTLLDDNKGRNLVRVQDEDDNEGWIPREKYLKNTAPKKLTKLQRYQATVEVIRRAPIAYEIAGWIASHSSNIHVSTPPKSVDDTKNLLDSHHVDYEMGKTLTVSTDATQGRSFSVVTDNHGRASQLFAATEVLSTIYQNNSNKVSLQAREFVLEFLMGDLKFKLGKTQDIALILSQVPEMFKADFLTGTAISVDIEVQV